MKKTIILNAQLSQTIATMGHTDSLTICDSGFPIPHSANRIDLALTQGTPNFLQTLDVVLSELFIERVLIAEEIKTHNPAILTALLARFTHLGEQQGNVIQISYISHEQFKNESHHSKAIVRTREFTPYANIILYSGVPF